MMRNLPILFFAIAVASCSPQVAGRGHLDATKKLSELPKDGAYKQDVLRLLGSPSTRSSFGEETWYYVSAKRENFAFFKPEITEQDVVAIRFDTDGKVEDVKHFTQADAKDVAVVERTTPTEGQEYGFWEQMLGNIGRFNNQRNGTAGSVGGVPGSGPGGR